MSSAAGNDVKDRIRQAIGIVDLVGRYLQLRQQGRMYVAICPWHDDSRPSLQVNPERQSWKCWVCDIGGDVFSFVMKHEGVDFPQALRLLAEMAGIPLTETGRRTGNVSAKDALYKATGWAEQQFHECLVGHPEGGVAREYLAERGIDQESILRYRVGYSPPAWQWLLDRSRSTPHVEKVLETVGLAARSSRSGRLYDRFRGRLIFPIRDPMARTIAFGGRILPGQDGDDKKAAKYVNSPETPLFSKSNQLYGLDLAREVIHKSHRAVVMEGYTDVVTARQFGIRDAVAVLGTALTASHVQLLRRYCQQVVLLLDGDAAGQRRANEVLELFISQQLDLRVVTLPSGLDPCDYLQQHGCEAMETLIENAVDALDHKLQVIARGIDPTRDTHRVHEVLEEILRVVSKAPRLAAHTDQSLRLREQQLLVRIARQFHVPEVELRQRLSDLRRSNRLRKTVAGKQPASSSREVLDPCDRELLEMLTQTPEQVRACQQQLDASELNSDLARSLFAVFVTLSETRDSFAFADVLSAVESPELKNILVELDESAQNKMRPESDTESEIGSISGLQNSTQRVQDVLDAYQRRRCERQLRATEAKLGSKQLDPDQQTQLLQELIAVKQKQNRTGIAAPTDG